MLFLLNFYENIINPTPGVSIVNAVVRESQLLICTLLMITKPWLGIIPGVLDRRDVGEDLIPTTHQTPD